MNVSRVHMRTLQWALTSLASDDGMCDGEDLGKVSD
jgi:hypothetical protein